MGKQAAPARAVSAVLAVLGFVCAAPSSAEASLFGGVSKIVLGVFQLPLGVLAGTITGPPLVGTALGAVNGAWQTVGLVTGGAFEVVASAVPLVKAAAPFVLPFLF